MALGQIFKTTRTNRGYSISEVADRIKMSPQMIADLEQEDYSRIAALIYGKGYVRKYAEFLGLDYRPLVEEFKNAFKVMAKHPLKVFRAFIESGLSLLGIYATVPAFFTGLNNFSFDLTEVMGRMILLNLVLYFSPTPGGSGVAEVGFVALFSSILPEGVDGIMAVMWRFAAEYLPFLLGAFVSIRAFGSDVLNMASINSSKKS